MAVSQEMGRPKERERDGRSAGSWNMQNTKNLYQVSQHWYMDEVYCTPNQLQ